MNRPPLTRTTSTHPYAYAVYGKQAAFGFLVLVAGFEIEALDGLLFTPVVGVVMLVGGVLGIYAIRLSHSCPHRDKGLRLELTSAWALGLVNLFVGVCLVITYGISRAQLTQVYVLGVFLGCLFRVVQIKRERRDLRLALASPSPADPPLAEPTDHDH